MVVRNIDRNAIGLKEDWEGNNAAFSCPACNKVFIVSALLHGGQRECPLRSQRVMSMAVNRAVAPPA
jgi:hypothetical protein